MKLSLTDRNPDSLNCCQGFIILDKVQGRTSTEEPPENLKRLVDLVTPNSEAYRTAFQHALGDTLVANNLDQATRVGLGKERRRVVTLDGNLVDTSDWLDVTVVEEGPNEAKGLGDALRGASTCVLCAAAHAGFEAAPRAIDCVVASLVLTAYGCKGVWAMALSDTDGIRPARHALRV